jgi:hypothetical protein
MAQRYHFEQTCPDFIGRLCGVSLPYVLPEVMTVDNASILQTKSGALYYTTEVFGFLMDHVIS